MEVSRLAIESLEERARRAGLSDPVGSTDDHESPPVSRQVGAVLTFPHPDRPPALVSVSPQKAGVAPSVIMPAPCEQGAVR
jgi:hypothetical protein